jgi:GntR family transcriptional regulator, arabinose operon transcriptional repressor
MTRKNSFIEIFEKFRTDILDGKMVYGNMLPSEKELSEQMGVSRPTIAKVYNTLQSEGLVKKKAGFGTMITHSLDKKQYTFGLLLPGSGETEIFRIIIDQFVQLEKERDFRCLWEGTVANNADVRKEIILRVCHSYIEKKVDGVIFSPLERTDRANDLNQKICNMFDSKNIPVVLMDRDIFLFPNRSKFDLVGIDNYQAGYMMAEHLVEAGCKTIHFFCRRNSAYTVDMRIAGCRSALNDAGIPFTKANIFVTEPNNAEEINKIPIDIKKTGIICANDSTAAVLMSTLSTAGLRIASDLLIVGFDDMKYSRNLQVPLTTYRQPCQDIGRHGIDMMFNRLQNPNQTAVTVSLLGKLIVRESSVFV